MLSKFKKIIYEKNILSLSTSLLGAFLGLVSFILLTRTFEKEIFGDWVLYTTLATFADLLRFGLTRNALVRFVSGGDEESKKAFLGSSYRIGLVMVFIVAIVLWPAYFILNQFDLDINNGYLMFLMWYPILALVNLSWNNSLSLFQAEQRFKDMLVIRVISLGSFVLFLVLNMFYLHWGIVEVVIAHVVSNLIPSIIVAIKKWDGLAYLSKSTKSTRKQMIDFGKYSMGTLVGSSLLRSADTFIIGFSPFLGSAGIAQYAIPLKLTDLLGIPLRSFTMTAFPRMSKKSLANDIEGLKKTFYAYSGAITILFLPVAVLGFIFAEPLVWALGGNEYKDSLPLLATIFRIFSLYSILLPIDRFTGVALDSINKPKFNFYKVIIMALANVVGDVIAVFWFQSLEAVAWVTVLFTVIGIIAGFNYLNRSIEVNYKSIVVEGVRFFKNIKEYV
jgi:O-antigen/teichoic acid export membrane protein